MRQLRIIKTFDEIEVEKDGAYEHPNAGGEWNNLDGEILWKGSYSALLESDYAYLISEFDEEDEGATDYDQLVVVDLEVYGATLYNYDCDPSGVVSYQDTYLEDVIGKAKVWAILSPADGMVIDYVFKAMEVEAMCQRHGWTVGHPDNDFIKPFGLVECTLGELLGEKLKSDFSDPYEH